MTTTKNAKSESITKSDSKQARCFAQKTNSEMNIVFLSGEANPLGIDPQERRFWGVTGAVKTHIALGKNHFAGFCARSLAPLGSAALLTEEEMDIIEQLRATPETGAYPDMIFEAADEIERLRNGFCGAQTLQFLSDVVTAAGLLRHGKTDKGLADRINDGAQRLRIIAVTPNALAQGPGRSSPGPAGAMGSAA